MLSSSKAKTSKELNHCLKVLRSVLERHIRIIDLFIGIFINHPACIKNREEKTSIEPTVASALTPMFQVFGSSANTIAVLSDAPGLHTRDCYCIARSVVEAAINICFILAEGPSAAERALKHAHQKSYKDLQRQSKVGESIIRLTLSKIPELSEINGLEKEIDEFTSRSGREKGWTDLSIDDRIAYSGQKLGKDVLTSLHFARFAVYRHSSEIIHGTLFGALYFLGLTTPSPPVSISSFSENIGQQHMLVLMATNLAFSAVIEAFHQRYGYKSAQKESKALFDEIWDVPYFCKNEE